MNSSSGQEQKTWLLVLQGDVTEVTDTTMTLLPNPQAIAFTDRPNRIARVIDVSDIAAAWGEGGDFMASAPNASLIDEKNGEMGVIEITGVSGSQAEMKLQFHRLEGRLPAVGDRIGLTVDGLGCGLDPNCIL